MATNLHKIQLTYTMEYTKRVFIEDFFNDLFADQ